MRRHVWLAAALTVAWAGMAASAQEKRVGRCGTGDLLAAMEWEAARTAAEEAAAKTVMEKGRMTVPSREKKGLVLHYAFGKGAKWETGSVVKDLSGGGHDGRVEGDGLEVVRGIGKQGKAVRFDGKVDYIRVPRDEALEPDEITVAAWVKIRAGENLTESGTLVFKRNSSFHDNESYGLAVYPNRIVRADVSSPRCGHNRVDSSVPMAPGVWHHVAMAFRGGETRLYLDGVLVATGSYPPALDHNAGADLLVGVRDHAEYPMGRFGAFDLAELRIWDEALDGERVAALYRERAGWKGVAKPEDNRAPAAQPPRKFPAWEPGPGKDGGPWAAWERDLRALVAQGRRDKAASPEFLDALEMLANRHKGRGPVKVLGQLPMREEWGGWGWPEGWEAVRREVWKFGDGAARQVESKADTRYVLFYEPGMAWSDYEVTFCFESGAWFTPPMRSSAVLYFRYRGVDDSYSLWLDGAGDLSLISLDKGHGGKQRILSRMPLDGEVIRDGKPWTVKVHGEEIEVWHEGKRLLYATDWAHPKGTVGLESVHIPMKFGGLEVR